MISIWEKETCYSDSDVCIAGSGLMGLWTAWELLQRKSGLRITIADAAPVPALASTRNAGFACFGSPGELWADIETMGEDAAWETVAMRYEGIAQIRAVWGDDAIGYEPLGGYEVFSESPEWKGKALQEKLDHLNKGLQRITGQNTTYRDCSDSMAAMGFTGFDSMAGNGIEGGLHSGKLVQTMLRALQIAGVTILTGHRITAAEQQGHGFSLRLQCQNKTITMHTGALVWATNAATGLLPGMPVQVVPARGQVMVSPPIQSLALRGTFHMDEGFYYFRNLGNRLLIGGARNKAMAASETFDDTPDATITAYLHLFIAKHLPQAAAYLMQPGWMNWAGIMGMSSNKLPLMEALRPNEWVVLACNGMGVALTPVWARRLAGKML